MMVVHSNGLGSVGGVGSVGSVGSVESVEKKCIFSPLLCRTTMILFHLTCVDALSATASFILY
ncbi:hypothetical protein [Dapis sp. BLCC M229]|uniref:hypothetical protein n=1 Tax=Dapis sp. BLCC M229 TaxID=3400188 RepID=UPI003CF2B85A